LIGTPAKIDFSIAGSPSGVPGILMKTFSSARPWRSAACWIDFCVS
jgi:hypothetical protein